MAISNELSGEIAAAILATNRISPQQRSDFKETILKIHSVLQQMSDRTKRFSDEAGHTEPVEKRNRACR
jgi:hypothetical protein